jgi:hypothetical protein
MPFALAAAAIAMMVPAMTANAAGPVTAPLQDPQPVTGYATPQKCVVAGQPTNVTYMVDNYDNVAHDAVVWVYGIDKSVNPDPPQLGPEVEIDVTRSRLHPTAAPYSWQWHVRIPANASIMLILYVTKAPPAYVPQDWNPAWGSKPQPRLWLTGTVNVRYTSYVIDMPAAPVYCPAKG